MRGVRNSFRAAGLLLALIAFALKAALPAGFMLAPAHGAPIVVICSGQGPVAATIDPHSGALAPLGDAPDDQRRAGDQICPFAALTPIAPAPILVVLAAPLSASVPAETLATIPDAPQTPTGPPLPARGPPTLA